MTKGPRTLSMRILDARKINYTVHLCSDTIHDAVQVAAALGVPPKQVFKTLVLLREDAPLAHPILVMVPADREIDLRPFARVIGSKSVRMASQDQAEKLTGMKVGGISAIALLNRPFDVYIDQSVGSFEQILVSGGQRGIALQVRVNDLLAVTGAQVVIATSPKE
jgi:Cys-tRNA(Pro)/Cys-tRNA(Cys) deacylase